MAGFRSSIWPTFSKNEGAYVVTWVLCIRAHFVFLAMKKILIFSLVYYPRYIGGAEVAIKEITERISPEEIQFDMVTLATDLPETEILGNVTVYRILPRISRFSERFGIRLSHYLYPFAALLKARELHKKYCYYAIWAMMANYAGFAALFFKYFNKEVFFLLSLQEGDPIAHIKRRVGALFPLYRAIFTRADRIQAISKYLARFAHEMGHLKEVVLIPNGANLLSFSRRISKEERVFFRESHGVGDRDIVLVTASRLVEKNAIDDVLKALPLLAENVKFFIAGEGANRKALEDLSYTLGVKERVRFLGFVSHEDLPRVFMASDIFIRPSLSEGMGNAFIEAMAAGLPVIATQVGGISDFLFDPIKNSQKEPTGLAVEVKNPQSVAAAVSRYIEDPHLKYRIVENALRLVRERYDWTTVVDDIKSKFFA